MIDSVKLGRILAGETAPILIGLFVWYKYAQWKKKKQTTISKTE